MKFPLSGKVAIITGAGRGIGLAIARLFLDSGAMVAALDRDSPEPELTASEHRDRIMVGRGDVTDSAFVGEFVAATLEKYGRVDILVNNAGVIRDNFVEKISDDDWDLVLGVNLKGPFILSRAVAPHFRQAKSGAIVNISSRAWLGNVGQANYSASKGGLVSLTRTLALELARYQVRVNAVAPGLIDTSMTQNLSPGARERLLKMQPTGQMGTVADIAHAVAFLASDLASFITGQVLHVDGGKSCGLLGL